MLAAPVGWIPWSHSFSRGKVFFTQHQLWFHLGCSNQPGSVCSLEVICAQVSTMQRSGCVFACGCVAEPLSIHTHDTKYDLQLHALICNSILTPDLHQCTWSRTLETNCLAYSTAGLLNSSLVQGEPLAALWSIVSSGCSYTTGHGRPHPSCPARYTTFCYCMLILHHPVYMLDSVLAQSL